MLGTYLVVRHERRVHERRCHRRPRLGAHVGISVLWGWIGAALLASLWGPLGVLGLIAVGLPCFLLLHRYDR